MYEKIRLGSLCSIKLQKIYVKSNMEFVSSSAPCLILEYLYSQSCMSMHCMLLFFFLKVCSLSFLKQMLECFIQSFTHYYISDCNMHVFYGRFLGLLYPHAQHNTSACNNSIKLLKISTHLFTNEHTLKHSNVYIYNICFLNRDKEN